MQKLEDIVLKKGDIVYFDNRTSEIIGITSNNMTLKEYKRYVSPIIKIERPTNYETIYEAPEQILTQKEKEYLENFLRPFRNRIIKIEKRVAEENSRYIHIIGKSSKDNVWLPSFKADTMYKGMGLNKEYTLKELGLFE